jgi:hypothetical protein
MNFRLVGRMLMLVTAVLPGVAVVMDMGVHRMSMFMGVLMEMLMRVRVSVFMEVPHPPFGFHGYAHGCAHGYAHENAIAYVRACLSWDSPITPGVIQEVGETTPGKALALREAPEVKPPGNSPKRHGDYNTPRR